MPNAPAVSPTKGTNSNATASPAVLLSKNTQAIVSNNKKDISAVANSLL